MEKNSKLGLIEKRLQAQKVLDKKYGDTGDVWEDVDEHERDVFDKDGYFDVMDQEAQISASDMALLDKFAKSAPKAAKSSSEPASKASGQGTTLADLIMSKMATGNFEDGIDTGDDKMASDLDPKIVAAYKKLGIVLKTYRSGKLPKAFKVIPQTANWEDLLFLTSPEKWSRHATYEATKIFASNLNGKMA